MKKLIVHFDKKISLQEFDKQIPKLVDIFPSEISVLISVRIKQNYIEACLVKNPRKYSTERWEWDLNTNTHSNLEDYFQTIN